MSVTSSRNDRTFNDDSAARLSAIVESSDDAIISTDLNGTITSWNHAAERLYGYPAGEILGESVAILIPQERQDEEPAILRRVLYGERVEHYETQRKTKDGMIVDISLTVSPLRDADGSIVGASKIARDITQRKRREELLAQQSLRLATLNRLAKIISSELDLQRIVQLVTDISTKLTGAKFGAFFYNVTAENGESYQLYTLSGAPQEAFDKFGLPRNTAVFEPTFRGAEVVRSADIRQDPRYGKNAPHYGMPKGHLPVVSYLAVPIIGRSGVLGGLFFGHSEPGVFTQEAETIAVEIASHAAIAIDNAHLHRSMQAEVDRRRRAEEAKELLLGEIQHRVKNTLGTVQAIAAQTFRSSSAAEHKLFSARVKALSNAHDVLTRNDWRRADVREIVEQALAPFGARDTGRIQIKGPEASLNPRISLLLSMILHELGTNAVKYGALSNDAGSLEVEWRLRDGNEKTMSLKWCESNGPPVHPPRRKGFGTTLIERALEGERGKAQVEFAANGVKCTLLIPL